MSGAKHTPGPWRVDPLHCADIQTQDGCEIGSCWKHADFGTELVVSGIIAADYFEMRANASLIAAAPDMLEALRTLSALANTMSWDAKMRDAASQISRIALSAIAKAEGR